MSNKTWQIAQARELAKYQKKLREAHDRIERDIEELYSAMMVMLVRNGNTPEDAKELLDQIGQLWNDVANDPDTNMLEVCYKETGYNFKDTAHFSEEELEDYED